VKTPGTGLLFLRQRFPLVGVLGAAVVGILLSSCLGDSEWFWIALIVLLPMLCVIKRKEGGMVLAFTVACFACLQFWEWNDAPARKLALWFESHPQEFSVQGIIDSEPKVSPTGAATFFMRTEKLAKTGAEASPILLPVKVRVRWSGEMPSYGDRVNFQALALRPSLPRNPGGFDYRLWLERHGVYTQFSIDPSEPGKILSQGHGNPLMTWALSARHRMEEILSTDLGGAPMELSAIRGITLGITETTPEGFIDDFRFTGTMHLFAVSGLHVGMLAVMIWFVLRAARLPRPWAVVVIIPLLFFYVAITGLKSGSIRSAFMISLLLFGSVLYRRPLSINILAAAALIQLALDPNALFSAGWQFSYSVVFAILALAPPLESWLCMLHQPDPFIPHKILTRWERRQYSFWKYAAGLISVSTTAWIGSLLPTIAYFHLISFSAIGANLLAVPLAFAVLALGAMALLAGSVSLWAAGAFNNANWLVTKLLLIVVHSSSLMPGGHWFVGPPGKPYPVITLLDLNGCSCVVVQRDGKFALVNAGRKKDAMRDILPFLEMRGANAIGNILITQADAAHLGGVPEIAREFPVGSVGMVDEKSRSVVAKGVMNSFAEKMTKLQLGVPFPMLRDVTGEVLFHSDNASALLLHCGEIRILFLSALTPESSRQLLSLPKESLHAGVLVMPLGGLEILSTLQLIRQIAPKVVISPVDGLKRNGVPSPEWNQLLTAEGIQLIRQDESGAVIIGAIPNQATIRAFLEKKERTLPVP